MTTLLDDIAMGTFATVRVLCSGKGARLWAAPDKDGRIEIETVVPAPMICDGLTTIGWPFTIVAIRLEPSLGIWMVWLLKITLLDETATGTSAIVKMLGV